MTTLQPGHSNDKLLDLQQWQKIFLLWSAQTGCQDHPASYSTELSSRVKQLLYMKLTSTGEVRIMYSYTSSPPNASTVLH